MIVERRYARWIEATNEFAAEAPHLLANEATRAVLDWCRQVYLKPSSDVTISMSDSHADFFCRNMVAVVAEVKATGLPPEERLPPNWRTRFKAWRASRH